MKFTKQTKTNKQKQNKKNKQTPAATADNCPASFLDHKGTEMINVDLKGWVVRYASYLILTKVTPFSARISLHQNFLLDLEMTGLQDFEYQGCQKTCKKKKLTYCQHA